MALMNQAENVRQQYGDDRNLSARMMLHAKYSTNPLGWTNWLFGHYAFAEGFHILELGCGNAGQWEGNIGRLPPGCLLVLTDLSMGMAEAAWRKFSGCGNVLAQRADIMDIPFPDESFDLVIANHMLYHVPDLDKALPEVRRVLKAEGRFYAATNGNNGMQAYFRKALKAFNPQLNAFAGDFPFSLQNGREILGGYFSRIERYDYEDSLAVTHTGDLMAWLRSTISLSGLDEAALDGLYEYFEAIRKAEGDLRIPKESGLFLCTK